MILIEPPPTFKEYIESLSKKAKQNYAYTTKKNQDLTYESLPFVREEVEKFMQLWERQLIRGEYKQWAFPVEHVADLQSKGLLKVYGASRNGQRVSIHFIQKQEGFWECHPPLYEKQFGNARYLGKFMWFNLIRIACEEGLGILNMGGGIDTSWHEMIRRREEFPNPAYKWIYVPEVVKTYPTMSKDYEIKEINNIKYLNERI